MEQWPIRLPRLRMNLDFMPSPVDEHPGLLIRDSYGYSDKVLIIPPPLVQCLACFDGEQTELDLRALLVRMTGELDVGGLEQQLIDNLSTAGFLHDDIYPEMREAKHREFAESESRSSSHAGTAYPEEPDAVRATLDEYLKGSEVDEGRWQAHRNRSASCESFWRLADLPQCLQRSRSRASGTNIRHSRNFALWRAGSIRSYPQTV